MPAVPLQPGQSVTTTQPTITVAAMKKTGIFTFSVVVTDDAGLVGRAEFKVTVR